MDIETKEEIFQFPGIEIKIMVVKNIEKLCAEPENEEKIPYWADIWPAARVMAREIWHEINFNGAEVLELGAGLGLPGVTAALKGAVITFSDHKEEALKMALDNAQINGINNAEVYLGDWRDFRLNKKFDWILASDLLYNPSSNPFAEKVLQNNIKQTGKILIAHSCREATYFSIERLMKAGNFKETLKEQTITLNNPYFPNYKIALHYLEKR